jgi:uncharacterized protein
MALLERLSLLIGLALLAVAFVLGSIFIGHGIRDKNRNDVISVTGSAKKRIESDYVVWSVFVTSEQPAAQQAARELTGWTNKIRSFLADSGIEEGELSVDPISTETVSRRGQVVSYWLTRGFEIRSQRVAAVTDVADRSAQLLAQGVPLQADPLQYVYTKLPTLRQQLLAQATKDARARAKVIVEATGSHLGKLRRVSVGVFQITSPNSTEVEDYGVYDTSTLQKDVTAVVNVTFALG